MTKSITAIREHATQLAALLTKIEDIKIEAKALCEIAESKGVSAKQLRKVAKEMIMDSSKRADKYAEEEQLDMFRAELGLLNDERDVYMMDAVA